MYESPHVITHHMEEKQLYSDKRAKQYQPEKSIWRYFISRSQNIARKRCKVARPADWHMISPTLSQSWPFLEFRQTQGKNLVSNQALENLDCYSLTHEREKKESEDV